MHLVGNHKLSAKLCQVVKCRIPSRILALSLTQESKFSFASFNSAALFFPEW